MKPLGPGDPQRIGRYRLAVELGRGGMGRVLLGSAPDGRLVAVKQVRAQFAEDDGFRARFHREVAASRRVSGRYTAAVVDADPDGPAPWLASEFVPGPSLREAVDAAGPLPADAVLRLAAGLAAALTEIHGAGLVHRDLKPSNVLLTDDGPRVIDFGIARATDTQGGTEVTHTGWLVGSPGFMSPEQAEGKPVTPASDMFSLGTVLVMACTGGNPFDGASTPQTLYNVVFAEPDLAAVPEPVRDVAARCLAKDPDQRPAPSEVLAALGDLAPGDQPWPPAVHDMIAAQRTELDRLLDAAGERARLLGTLAALFAAAVQQRTEAGQRPTAIQQLPAVPTDPPTLRQPEFPAAQPPPPQQQPAAAPPPQQPAFPTGQVAAQQPEFLAGQAAPPPLPPGPPAAPYGMPPVPVVPAQRRSNAGMIVGIVAGALALVLVACLVGGIAVYNTISSSASAGSGHSPAPTSPPSPTYTDTYSPSPSPSPTARDPYTLDEESTDDTPLEWSQFFRNEVDSYELTATGPYSACSDAGGDATDTLMNKHGCGSMLTADYVDSSNGLLASVMVIPLSDSGDANTVDSSFSNESEAYDELTWYCPKSGAGSNLCSGNSPRWWGWHVAYHRYELVAIILEDDGSDTTNNSATSALADAVIDSIEDQMLVIQ